MGVCELNLSRSLFAEFTGTMFLLATVVGSGIMAENLSGGNVAIALLGNTIPTGAILFVLITMLGPVSGAHFNPAVSLVFFLRAQLSPGRFAGYVIIQIAGAVAGVWLAHMMFDLEIIQFSQKERFSDGQLLSEMVATFGLIFAILATLRANGDKVAMVVGLYITAAYWFTASTSFANPAVTIARSLTDTFAGIMPAHMPWFIGSQLAGAVIAWGVCGWLFANREDA